MGLFFEPCYHESVKKEKFLILEISPAGTNGLFLSIAPDRSIILEKFVPNLNLKKFLKSPARRLTQKAWEGEYLFKSRRKVIVSAHPSLATTIPVPLDLSRERAEAKYEITLAELENLVAQAMGKIFNQCRTEAAKRLSVHEIDAILVGAKARGFKVDGKSVVNPAGFTGKKISLLLELRFTTREMFESLKNFFNAPEDFFFVEAPQAQLFSIVRTRKLPISLIVAEEGGASVYVLQEAAKGYPVLYREKLGWDFHEFVRSVARELGVSMSVANELYGQYVKGDMSESAARAFSKMIDPARRAFFDAMTKEKLHGSVYIDAPYELPFPLPHRHEGSTIEHIPLGEILESLDFSPEFGTSPVEERVLARHLLPFLEAYFDKSNSEINQKLRRRLHWLVM